MLLNSREEGSNEDHERAVGEVHRGADGNPERGGKGYIYRGEVRTIVVEDNTLKVQFAWLAKGDGVQPGALPVPRGWVNHEDLSYGASLEIYSVSNIGSSGYGGDRICLNSAIVGETVVLFPPDGSKLDPAKVKGLELESK